MRKFNSGTGFALSVVTAGTMKVGSKTFHAEREKTK
jgi:hypothetical protein